MFVLAWKNQAWILQIILALAKQNCAENVVLIVGNSSRALFSSSRNDPRDSFARAISSREMAPTWTRHKPDAQITIWDSLGEIGGEIYKRGTSRDFPLGSYCLRSVLVVSDFWVREERHILTHVVAFYPLPISTWNLDGKSFSESWIEILDQMEHSY